MVRYCSKACLYQNNTAHFMQQCGKLTLKMKADKDTIVNRQVNIPRPVATEHWRPELHRQMVRHCQDQSAEYFIYNDGIQWMDAGSPAGWPMEQHGRGKLIKKVKFTEQGSFVPSKHIFRRLLRLCFFISPNREDMSRWLFKFIRHRLTELGELTPVVLECLAWQVTRETGLEALPSQMRNDEGPENWPHMIKALEELEAMFGSELDGTGPLGVEWTNEV